ncbi:class I SAM-dependent DNA methyltransferase [Trichlorobacter lovleyi]|uniref:site-specific DNA-methyltransferase (adenine-specific) n=1 Tax=Trichlorobacter lovleyi (strain ATCC BAA-1151 / DSM 17278 / SZ) TaxID=398767 RepID=B3E899_TRIL1|nr:class I SAM-dependent DNA methyltransferase [Trichlorobacter lovleyi]ACD95136.1 N-6 DNA methylase [Trichlorobacter lovleyi SZ]
MKNIGTIIKRLQNTMRKDQGVSGDAQRIEQLGWMITLKILDDKDKELEILQEAYASPIPSAVQWRAWAADAEGMTGDELKEFIDLKLFPALKNLDISTGNKRALIIREIFEGTNNYMKNGTVIRQVLNELNQIDFNSSDDRHIFGDIYETILRDLQSAGNYGEFYTPRALTEFMTAIINPRLGEKVLDPACGTGGFLTCAIENIRRQDVKNVEDLQTLQSTIHGMEFKPLPFMLSVTNMILHDIEVPNVDYTDSLNREYTSIGAKDRVDVILANPPFGASVTDGVETNFPLNYRTTESADLFLLLMIRYLKDGGRAAIVLPDGSLTGDGVKQRIRQHWLEGCNLHTIVRLPNSVFQPYASVATNLLFFTKGEPTKEIWYWEHQLPEGVKSYSKTKPIQSAEFNRLKEWWNNRQESDQAWRVSIDTLTANSYNLDTKNPHIKDTGHAHTSAELLELLHQSFQKSDSLLQTLRKELACV